MQYNEITKAFQSEEGINKLKEQLQQDYFDIIDNYTGQLVADVLQTSEELRQAKTILTGLTASLQPIYSKALSLKKQLEYRYYVAKAQECSTSGAKFVSAATEIESKDAVRAYRDIRDLLCGYIKAAESLIYDCKDRLEVNRREYKQTQEEG